MFDIANTIKEISILALPFLLAITCHEASHGFAAYLLGDPTAKQAGRLTLNPLKHLDPMGTLALILTRMIGWAKPVPVNPSYFKNPQRDMMLVALAGPAANMALAIMFSIVVKIIFSMDINGLSPLMLRILEPTVKIANAGVVINLALCFFNLLPIPPLDGSKIIAGFLPRRAAYQYMSFRYGFIIVILLAMLGILGKIISPVIGFFYNFLVH
ncbi:site-2 protease family protein [Maridesulfovibrio hydrothermalis]|uniref:Peptidase M50 n=1 Tax=Maridesulfovibrio hydrothermalis AM13 = DSM 14728 TaxID=1121451 RepID=L0REK2_9BACT|nr:site-2 protease family protein [Maridesulfovibrio hydrothermalis]CCO23966.1 Peptidase M50 [Maridesulfovibrio hydrothermalis AM13 = DSM 14728]